MGLVSALVRDPPIRLSRSFSLWDDLTRTAPDLTPAWHGEELASREAGLHSGESAFEEWTQSKCSIEREIQ